MARKVMSAGAVGPKSIAKKLPAMLTYTLSLLNQPSHGLYKQYTALPNQNVKGEVLHATLFYALPQTLCHTGLVTL